MAKNKQRAAKRANASAAVPKKAVNMGPQRGDNTFPASNKPRVNDTSRTTPTAVKKVRDVKGDAANDPA